MKNDKKSLLVTNFAYGILPKSVMRDRSITVGAKAIYALLCTYAGSKGSAFPSIGLIMSDLNMSKNAYYKHMDVLKDSCYIRVTQTKDGGGKFKRNVYDLFDKPYTQLGDTVKGDTGFGDPVNGATKNNNIKINSLKNNNTKVVELPAEATQLSQRLLNWIKKNYPQREHKDNHLNKWADSIDKINRIDKKDWKKIQEVMDWSQKDEFWRQNIQSGSKLRTKFTVLEDRMFEENKKNQKARFVIGSSPPKHEQPKEIKRADINSEGYKRFQKMKEELLKKKSVE